MIEDRLEKKDPMPKYFEEMEKQDLKSQVLLRLKKDRPGRCFSELVTLNIYNIGRKTKAFRVK